MNEGTTIWSGTVTNRGLARAGCGIPCGGRRCKARKRRNPRLREGGDFQKGGEEHMKKLVYLACKLIIHPVRGGVNRKL